jgi:hypothetical protein
LTKNNPVVCNHSTATYHRYIPLMSRSVFDDILRSKSPQVVVVVQPEQASK